MKALPFDLPDLGGHPLCAETDPDAFFPEKGNSNAAAKKVCSGCEIKNACLKWALDNDERFGVWGGLSERERRRLANKNGKPAVSRPRADSPIVHGTEAGYAAHRRREEKACRSCTEGLRVAQVIRRGGAA